MKAADKIKTCPSCGSSGMGNYCSSCGQAFDIKRISLTSLLQDIFYFFTNLDKGFPYTLKELIIAPGHMQRVYVEGKRNKHQQPFSMFVICATITAVSRYWLMNALTKFHPEISTITEANFFREYMVLTYVALLPVYALITFLFFTKTKYNYAEIGVLLLYTISVFFLIAPLFTLLKFIWPYLDTAYVEFPVFSAYFGISLINFLKDLSWQKVLIKSLFIITAVFYLNQITEDFVVWLISQP